MKGLLLTVIVALFTFPARADEGMWIPMLIGRNIQHMQELGLRLSADDIYSVNKACLKDAVVQFGSGCTGVIVSEQGLLLTNHHCGFGSIQRNSSLENDYLRDGFWASDRKEELPNPGLTVTRLVRMEDVTAILLDGIAEDITESRRNQIIRQRTDSLEKAAVAGTWYTGRIRSFFSGNQYFLFVLEIFRDIRLVGAPPVSIGSFGGDTDNWVWPRHTGDFSVFRIYADSLNRPSGYNTLNKPYVPLYVIPVATRGVAENDFTMVFGFPGTTREYLPSYAVDLIALKENRIRVKLRTQRLDIMRPFMEQDPLIRLQYATKQTRIANGWKKMIGETRGIERLDGIAVKRYRESIFIRSDDGNLLPAFKETYEAIEPYVLASAWITEGPMSVELIQFAGRFREVLELAKKGSPDEEKWNETVGQLIRSAGAFYKEYQPEIDRRIARAVTGSLIQGMDSPLRGIVISPFGRITSDNAESYIDDLFAKSMLPDSSRTLSVMRRLTPKKAGRLEKDPAILLAMRLNEIYDGKIRRVVMDFQPRIDSLQRKYMQGIMLLDPDRFFYPDANGTLRISYGQVKGFSPADAVLYRYYTTLDGVMEKADSAITDYRVDKKLTELFRDKNFGEYADEDGKMRVAFIASNHTSGGNSGSPVLNAHGELVGLNFDRNWEGTMSDLMYDPDQCRNITLDIRYCLFIMDMFAGAENLVREIKEYRRN